MGTASRAIRHESEMASGSACNGRRCFEVIERGRRIAREEYWCCKLRRRIDPMDVECPIGIGGAPRGGGS